MRGDRVVDVFQKSLFRERRQDVFLIICRFRKPLHHRSLEAKNAGVSVPPRKLGRMEGNDR